MSSVRASGNSRFTSDGEISCTSTPQKRLNAATRRYSSSRSASAATSMNPTGLNPVACPVIGFELAVEIARVLAHLGRRLGRGPERHHQAGRMPGRAGREPVALQQHHVLPAHAGEVIGHRGADDAAPDHHDRARDPAMLAIGHLADCLPKPLGATAGTAPAGATDRSYPSPRSAPRHCARAPRSAPRGVRAPARPRR